MSGESKPERLPTRIQLKRTKGWKMPPGTVVCSRPGRYGNPWKVSFASEIGRYVVTRWNGCRGSWDNYRFKTMGQTEALSICLELYRRALRMRLRRDPAFMDPVRRALFVACWCDPKDRCHVDVILEELAR